MIGLPFCDGSVPRSRLEHEARLAALHARPEPADPYGGEPLYDPTDDTEPE